MPTFTTTATYQNGILIPKIKPSYHPEEVLVVFIEPKIAAMSRQTRILKILRHSFGAWDVESSGVEYENKIRSEAEEHFKKLRV